MKLIHNGQSFTSTAAPRQNVEADVIQGLFERVKQLEVQFHQYSQNSIQQESDGLTGVLLDGAGI
jgi:hypothetical protein